MSEDTLLEVRDLKLHYPLRRGVLRRVAGHVKAVDGVTLSMRRGETLGLVGESGCGKTSLGRTILHLVKPTAGSVLFKGRDVAELARREPARLRRGMQIIFQDPYGSLNPRLRAAAIVGEAPLYHGLVGRKDLALYVADMMRRVGLRPEDGRKRPRAFSGGQRQRLGIARALAMRPEFVVCDEAVSALDVSIQSQVLNLLAALREEFGLTYLFISHDLSVVRHVSDRVAVLYRGKLVEVGLRDAFFAGALHPYSQILLAAVPVADPDAPRHRPPVRGELSAPAAASGGCVFAPRCPHAMERCREEEPLLRECGTGHAAACFLLH